MILSGGVIEWRKMSMASLKGVRRVNEAGWRIVTGPAPFAAREADAVAFCGTAVLTCAGGLGLAAYTTNGSRATVTNAVVARFSGTNTLRLPMLFLPAE
jgi:hypothetical protein